MLDQSNIKYCPLCGTKISFGEKFCTKCKYDLNDYQTAIENISLTKEPIPAASPLSEKISLTKEPTLAANPLSEKVSLAKEPIPAASPLSEKVSLEEEPTPAARPTMSLSEHGNANQSRLSRIKAKVFKKPYIAAGLAAMLLITFGFSYYMGYLTEPEEEIPPYAESQNPPSQEEMPSKEIPIIAEQKVEEPPIEKEEFDDRLKKNERINPEAEIARQTFLIYHQAIVNGDYETAYSMLTAEQKRRVGDFNTYVNSQSDTLNGVITSIYTMDSSPESVTIGYKMTIDDTISDRWSRTQVFRGQVTLVERGGDWYILNAQSRRAEELIKKDL